MLTGDGKIVNQCLNGEPEAFGLLVDRYKASIYALVYSRVRNFHDAEDITQEIFIKAYRNLRALKQQDNFHYWLYSISYNYCRNWLRAKSNRPDSEFIEDQDPEEIERILSDSSIDAYQDSIMSEDVRNALDSLPEAYREVLILYYLGGMDSVEIAKAIGTSPANIRQRLSRAREQFREEVLAMMRPAYEQQRLTATFTFRIIETVKHIKINPMPTMKGLPWGLSIATGIIITIMSLNPAMISINDIGTPVFAPLPSETKVFKIGEIPMDVIKTSNITVISGDMGKGKGGEPKPDMQNALFMAPQGEGGEWVRKADMPTGRHNFSASAVKGKIYCIGGIRFDNAGNFTILSDVTEYDPITDRWTKKADIPEPRFNHNACVINDKILVIGGADKNGLPSESVRNIMEYDPELNKWRKKSDMPEAIVSPSSCILNGKIYIIGGMGLENNVGTSTVEEYDPVIDKWTRKSDMPTARYNFCAAAVNNCIYAMGGMIDNNNPARTMEAYDPAVDKWSRKADPITLRGGLSASVVNGKIFVIGGMDAPNDFCATVEEYDPTTDTWARKKDMPTKRYGLSTAVYNGKIYAIGGSISAVFPWINTSVLEEYTPEGWQPFSISPQSKLSKTWGTIKQSK